MVNIGPNHKQTMLHNNIIYCTDISTSSSVPFVRYAMPPYSSAAGAMIVQMKKKLRLQYNVQSRRRRSWKGESQKSIKARSSLLWYSLLTRWRRHTFRKHLLPPHRGRLGVDSSFPQNVSNRIQDSTVSQPRYKMQNLHRHENLRCQWILLHTCLWNK